MVLTLRNKHTGVIAEAVPAFVTPPPNGTLIDNTAFIELGGSEIDADVRDYDVWYDGKYIDLRYAGHEGFLEPKLIRTEHNKWVLES